MWTECDNIPRRMDKSQLERLWVGIVVVINAVFLAYLYAYQESGEFRFGIPEALLVFAAFVLGVVTVNSVMGWLYLGRPDLTELFVPQGKRTTESPVTEDD